MTKKAKLLKQAIGSPQNLTFKELTALASSLGFQLARTQGSHHLFSHQGVVEMLNLQSYDGKAKAYQVRQLLKLAEKYGLKMDEKP